MKNDHGGDVYRCKIDLDYSVCINPLGMPAAAFEAAVDGLKKCMSYPDIRAEALRKAIAGYLTDTLAPVTTEEILPGNGAAELIYEIVRGIRPAKVIVTVPGFSEYGAAAENQECPLEKIVLREKDGFCWTKERRQELLKMIEENSLIFLCNPNNPTGWLFERSELLEILAACEKKHAYLCVDECFLPFCENEKDYSLVSFFSGHPQLLILRAFTKIYAMAGLRLGYLLCADETLRNRFRNDLQPWNVSVPAQQAGTAALPDRAYRERTAVLIREEKAWLKKELQDGLAEKIYGSDANFITFRAGEGLREKLMEKQVLIRKLSVPEEGFYYRIGIRTHEENAEFIRRWREIV